LVRYVRYSSRQERACGPSGRQVLCACTRGLPCLILSQELDALVS
jgi:hypothetical protein